MKIVPFHHVSQGSLRKPALHDSRVDVNDDLVLPVPGMEMRGNMVIPIHRDDDAEKPADDRHVIRLARTSPHDLGRSPGNQTME